MYRKNPVQAQCLYNLVVYLCVQFPLHENV